MLLVYAIDKMSQNLMHTIVFNIYELWLEKLNIMVLIQPLSMRLYFDFESFYNKA